MWFFAWHLLVAGGAAIDDSRAQAGPVGKLARLLVDLIGQLACGAHDERLWVGPPAVRLCLLHVIWMT